MTFSESLLLPSLVTLLVGGPVSFFASVLAVRLTFFLQTKQRAAHHLSDFFEGWRGVAEFNRYALRDNITRRFGSIAAEFRVQRQDQAAEDLSQVLDRITKTLDDAINEPPQRQLHLRAKSEELWLSAVIQEEAARHIPKWISDVAEIRPTFRELWRFGWFGLRRKKVKISRGY